MRIRVVRVTTSILVMLSLVLSFATVSASSTAANTNKLSKHARELLAQARVNGASSVTLLIASQPGANKKVANGLQGLGATIGYRDDALDYVRATVSIDKVDAAAQLSGVQAVDLNEIIPIGDPSPEVPWPPSRRRRRMPRRPTTIPTCPLATRAHRSLWPPTPTGMAAA